VRLFSSLTTRSPAIWQAEAIGNRGICWLVFRWAQADGPTAANSRLGESGMPCSFFQRRARCSTWSLLARLASVVKKVTMRFRLDEGTALAMAR
jgi:hypothetical protein